MFVSRSLKSTMVGVLQSIERKLPRTRISATVGCRLISRPLMSKTLKFSRDGLNCLCSRPSVSHSLGIRSLSSSEAASIFEVGSTNFMDVVMKSPEPVILDCFAEWCQPCKELTPRLEKAVSAKKGIRLAKLNVDLEPDIAGQLRVEVLPTLFLIYEGKVVDKVTGSLKPEGIEALISKGIGLSTTNSHNETLIAAGKLISEGKPKEAALLYSQVLAASRKTHGAVSVAGLALCAMASRDLPAAAELATLLRTDPEFKAHLEDPIVKQALTAVEIASEAHAVPEAEVAALRERVAADPADLPARSALATALFGRQRYGEAMDHALEIVRLDRAWDDGAGRRLLFRFFDTLGAGHEEVIRARKRLSILLF